MPDFMCNIYHKYMPDSQKIDYFFVWNKYWVEKIRQTSIARNIDISGWFIKKYSIEKSKLSGSGPRFFI